MKNKTIVMYSFLLIVFLFGNINSQDLSKVKESFKQIIDKELKSLQDWGALEKDNPEKTIKYWKYGNDWRAFYKHYYSYNYDIQKTNSIVSPYIGIVTFKGLRFEKVGNTKTECLNAEWKEVGKSIPTLKYTYQDTIWILKESPPAYRKH